jgi:hypothetical protein
MLAAAKKVPEQSRLMHDENRKSWSVEQHFLLLTFVTLSTPEEHFPQGRSSSWFTPSRVDDKHAEMNAFRVHVVDVLHVEKTVFSTKATNAL